MHLANSSQVDEKAESNLPALGFFISAPNKSFGDHLAEHFPLVWLKVLTQKQQASAPRLKILKEMKINFKMRQKATSIKKN